MTDSHPASRPDTLPSLIRVLHIDASRLKIEELRELLGLEPVSLMIKKSRLRWFGHVEQKDDHDWVIRCITSDAEVEGIRQRGRPKKTWWDCVKNDFESLGLSKNEVQSRNKWTGRIKGEPANPGSPGKWPLKLSVYVLKFTPCPEFLQVA